MKTDATSLHDALAILLRALKLPTFSRQYADLARRGEQEGWTYGQFLHALARAEVDERRRRRIERNQRESHLPSEKTLTLLDRTRLSPTVAKRLPSLCEGGFVERGENVLVFGLPGRGKTHTVCAIGHELIRRGYRVLFTATYALVQRLLGAKRDLRLERELAELDGFDAVILDDLGYVQQSREEMEVLFTFLAERYERRSVMITSNLVFSEWDRIFKDPMTTAAAVDRLVHHAVILEMTGATGRVPSVGEGGQRVGTNTASTARRGRSGANTGVTKSFREGGERDAATTTATTTTATTTTDGKTDDGAADGRSLQEATDEVV